jgi:hypothetical protein
MAALGNVVGQVTVSVAQVATSIAVSPNTDTLTTAAPTVQLSVVARDANNNIIASPNVTWSTANSALATVSNTGLVTGQSNGIVHIRAVSGTARDSARITVLLNTPPKPNPDSLGTSQNTTLELDDPGLLLNDSLGIPKGVITSFGGGDLGGSVSANDAGEEVTFGTGGSLVVNEDGSLEFTPSTNFTGEFEFLYRVSNSAGAATATVTIHVGIAPTAVDDNFATPLNTELSLNAASGVLSNDQSGLPTGQLISFGGGSLAGDAGRFAPGSRIAYGIGGSIRVNADGSLVFRPPTGFTGPFTFFYRLGNSAGTSDALVTITVN